MMRCDEVRDNLVAYLDSELTAEERERIESHLGNCPSCLRERAALDSTGSLLRILTRHDKAEVDLAKKVLETARGGDPWCRHIQKEFVALLDGELADGDAGPVVEHLAECEDCRHERRALVRTGDALAHWTLPDFDVDLLARLPGPGKPRGRILRLASLAAAAAACLLVAAGVSGLFRSAEKTLRDELAEDPELLEMVENLDWLESISDVELAMLNGRGD